nr:cyclophilin-like fold protein [Sedimentibacter sp.]
MINKLSLFLVIPLVFSLMACDVKNEETERDDALQANEQIIKSEDEDIPIQNSDEPGTEESNASEEETGGNYMKLQIGESVFKASLDNNSSVEALQEMLEEGSITIDMRDYANMEKVGSLGTSLPRNDEQITTEPGDLILYQGNSFVIYYAPNSWNFTRIGKIDNITQEELKKALGSGDVKVTLSLD